jgi:hypothetical protein
MRFRVKVFNATFNNISVISWRSVLLVEETEVPGENHPIVCIYYFNLEINLLEGNWIFLNMLVS